MNYHQTSGLFDRFYDGIDIQRYQSPGINDLGVNTLFFQLIGCFQRTAHIEQVGYDSYISSGAFHISFAEGNQVFRIIGHITLAGVEGLVLKEHHRIVISDGSAEQSGCVCGGGRTRYLQAWNVHKEGFHALGMSCRIATPDTLLATDDKGNFCVTAKDIAGLSGLIQQLVHSYKGEIHIHQLYNRTHACAGSSDTKPASEMGVLRTRSVPNSL